LGWVLSPKRFLTKAGSEKHILQLKLVCKLSGQEFKLIFRSSLQPKDLGRGPLGQEGAREAEDEISSLEEGFGSDLVSNAFSSGLGGACIFFSGGRLGDGVAGGWV